VQRCSVLLAFVLVASACSGAAPAPAQAVRSAPVASTKPSVPAARVSACSAKPSTVYGAEPVRFHVDAAPPGAVELILLDERAQVVSKQSLAAPGDFEPATLPSGDFMLQAGAERVSCAVTVNRELSRASQAAR
jgi:hypothetical protein